jgi:lysophospholipase L1-like esterase
MAIDKKSASLTIAALGTSLTARGAWLEALPDAIEHLSERPIRTLNFGRVGANSNWGRTIIGEVAQALPDIAIIEFASNDAALHRYVSLQRSAANLSAIIQSLRMGCIGSKIYLMTMSPAIGLHGLLRPRLGCYYDLYSDLADREQIGFIDNRPAWSALPRRELRRALADGRHPSKQFSLSITLVNVVREIVRDLTIAKSTD